MAPSLHVQKLLCCSAQLQKDSKRGIDVPYGTLPTGAETFMLFGSTAEGCQKGDKCPLLHPTYMCRNSVKFLYCDKVDCRFAHLKNCERPHTHHSSTAPSTYPHHIPHLHHSENRKGRQPTRHVQPRPPPLIQDSHSYSSHFPSLHRPHHWPPNQKARNPPPHHPYFPSPRETLFHLIPLLQNVAVQLS